MFKKTILLLIIVFSSCNFETPTQFSESALKEIVVALDGSQKTLQDILKQHKGKKIVIDIWASWCRDCLVNLPKTKKLQQDFSDVVFLFLSVDENPQAWKRRIQKNNIKGLHYNLPKGMKNGNLVDFLDLGWIPRYLVIDEQSNISLFKATKPIDKRIVDALQK